MKIAMLFPYAPAYREGIYRAIDETFDVDWYFCKNASRPMKLLDYSILDKVSTSMEEITIHGNIRYLKNFNPAEFKRYDAVILSGNIRNLSYWRLLFSCLRRKKYPKLILWTHGWYGRESVVQKIIKRLYLKKADNILLYGEYAKKLMCQQGFDSNKLFVIANSLDYDKQLKLRNVSKRTEIFKKQFKNDYPVIIFIGRLTYEKKIEMLIDSISCLKIEGVDFNLVLVGDGEAKKSLQKYTLEKNLMEHVCFWGSCYDEKINAELIYNADLCVSPGNVGLTAIHSLMFGCPVITHDESKFQGPEFEAIKEGLTGLFYKHNSTESLTKTIRQWFDTFNFNRDKVRINCYKEIDDRWNPQYQIKVLKNLLNTNI